MYFHGVHKLRYFSCKFLVQMSENSGGIDVFIIVLEDEPPQSAFVPFHTCYHPRVDYT